MPLVNNKGVDDSQRINLYTYPSPIEPHRQFTLGDLHGNTVKFIHALIRNGVCEADPRYYDYIIDYYKQKPMSDTHINDFCTIIDEYLTFKNTGTLVRLIGDIVADRGKNDWLTLKLLDKLRTEGIPVRILMSNHDDQFMKFFNDVNSLDELNEYNELGTGQANSFVGLVKYIKSPLDKATQEARFQEARRMVRESYLPNLVLLDYSLSDDGNKLTLFSHAPISRKDIVKVAREFGIDSSTITKSGEPVQDLIKVIQEINQTYQDLLQLDVHTAMLMSPAVKKIAWQRTTGDYPEPGLIQGNIDPRAEATSIFWVHGHDPLDNNAAENVCNLDNVVGKGNLENSADDARVAFVSNEAISPGPITAKTVINDRMISYYRKIHAIIDAKITNRELMSQLSTQLRTKMFEALDKLEQIIKNLETREVDLNSFADLKPAKIAFIKKNIDDVVSKHCIKLVPNYANLDETEKNQCKREQCEALLKLYESQSTRYSYLNRLIPILKEFKKTIPNNVYSPPAPRTANYVSPPVNQEAAAVNENALDNLNEILTRLNGVDGKVEFNMITTLQDYNNGNSVYSKEVIDKFIEINSKIKQIFNTKKPEVSLQDKYIDYIEVRLNYILNELDPLNPPGKDKASNFSAEIESMYIESPTTPPYLLARNLKQTTLYEINKCLNEPLSPNVTTTKFKNNITTIRQANEKCSDNNNSNNSNNSGFKP